MKKSKDIWFLIAVLAALVLFSLLFIAKNKPSEKQTVKIGVVLPLTGDLSNVGEFMKNSILLDTSDVDFVIEDCQGNPSKATMAVNKLINTDHVSGIVSSLSFLSEAINPVCEKRNIPHFILSFSPTLVEKGNVIQSFVSTRLESEAFVQFIKDKDVKSVAFLRHQEPDALYGFENIIKPELQNMGVSIIEHTFNNNTVKDFKTEVLKIKQSNPDLLVIQSLAFNIPNIMSAIKAYQITIPILGDINFLDIQDQTTMKLVEGIPFVGVDYVLSNNYKNYKEKYIQKYNKQPFALGGFAYDLGRYLTVFSGETSKDEILSTFNNATNIDIINDFEGSRFDQNGQENVKCVILTYRDCQIEEYK